MPPIPLLDLPLRTPRAADNRRTSPRSYERFHVHAAGEHELWEGINLSEGGMLCTAQEPVWPGTAVQVTLSTPKHEPVKLHAHVAELVPFGHTVAMRLKFLAVTEQHRTRLKGFLRALGWLS